MGVLDFPDYRQAHGVLPRHPSPRELLAETLEALTPPARVSVDEAAARWRMTRVGLHWQPWDNRAAPYMVEPQRMITSRRFAVVAFAGPAQSLKTSGLIENAIAHAITCQPRPVHVVQMSRDAAREFSIEKIGPMIRHSPALADRAMPGKGGDNIFDKVFRGGMRLSIGWPVVSQLSSRAIPLVLLTDYDRMPENIEGEGPPLSLARNRPKTFGTLGKVVVESSPGRPILSEAEKAMTPHEAPPTTGVLGVYNAGTRGRWYWTCPDCAGEFEPRLDRLEWPADCATPAAAGHRTVMPCPHCGSVLEARHKPALNESGRWLHETGDGGLAEIDDRAIRETDTVSYWLQGPAAALSSWADIVTQYLAAHETARRTGDDSELGTVLNTQFGMPYLPRALTSEADLDAGRLRGQAEQRPIGIAPAETRFITASVDVQSNRFVVQVDAWGAEMERWLIDRFDLHAPPDDAPRAGDRAIDPGRYAEDWGALERLAAAVYPVAGGGYGLRPAAIGVDSGGAPGVTDNAYKFWRAMRKAGNGRLWRLIRPRGGLLVDRAWIEAPKGGSRGRKAASDVPLLHLGVDRLKDAVAAQLGREASGPGAYHLPAGLPDEVFEEFAAERRTPKGWELKRGVRRNEALDLGVYNLGLALILKADRIDWSNPPSWAALGPTNANAVELIAEERAAETIEAAPARPEPPSENEDQRARRTGMRRTWLQPRERWL